MLKILGIRNKPRVDWNINYEFLKWLNKWFKEYKKNAMIDLEFRKYQYQDKIVTQRYIIDAIIKLTDELIKNDNFFFDDDKNTYEKVETIFELFHIVYWDMWW